MGIVGLRRVIEERNVLSQVHSDSLLVEGPRRVDIGVQLAILVLVPPLELLRWNAEMDGQDPVYLLQHLHLASAQRGLVRAVRRHSPQLRGEASRHAIEQGIHIARVAAALRLRHRILGHGPVLFYESHHVVPPSPVWNGIREECLQLTVIDIRIPRLDDGLEKQVRLLELVPEEEMILAELETGDAELLHYSRLHGVESCEEPASAAARLIGDSLRLDLVGEEIVMPDEEIPVVYQISHVVVRHGVDERPVGRVECEGLLELPYDVPGQRPLRRPGRGRDRQDRCGRQDREQDNPLSLHGSMLLSARVKDYTVAVKRPDCNEKTVEETRRAQRNTRSPAWAGIQQFEPSSSSIWSHPERSSSRTNSVPEWRGSVKLGW